jgi:hypothetical protein
MEINKFKMYLKEYATTRLECNRLLNELTWDCNNKEIEESNYSNYVQSMKDEVERLNHYMGGYLKQWLKEPCSNSNKLNSTAKNIWDKYFTSKDNLNIISDRQLWALVYGFMEVNPTKIEKKYGMNKDNEFVNLITA